MRCAYVLCLLMTSNTYFKKVVQVHYRGSCHCYIIVFYLTDSNIVSWLLEVWCIVVAVSNNDAHLV